jgi:tetratricopeptide (TPR) repeat protein
MLSKGVKDDKLITFEQMHPSMAKLPTQEATSLAFAEVYTVMEYLEKQKGRGAFAQLLTLMRQGKGPEKAMEELLGVPFSAFQRQWLAYLKARPSRAFDEEFVNVERLRFYDDKPGSELLDIGKKEARDLVHLGELLQARDRYGAAVVEYQKARTLIGDHNPILQTRLGKSLIVLKRYQEAVDVLVKSLDYYPNYFETYALLGEALWMLGRKEEAEEALVDALGINPFDPKPHELLAQIYERDGRVEQAEQSRRFARMVGR